MKLALVVQFLLAGALAPAASWRQINNGLPATSIGVSRLVVHPMTGELYVDTPNGVFRSTDGGQSWTAITTLTGSLMPDPNDPSTLYVIGSGLMKSIDGGATWTRTGLPDATALSLGSMAIDPGDSSKLYVIGALPGGPLLFRSTDAGVTWDTIHLPPGIGYLASPIFSRGDSSKIYFLYDGPADQRPVAGIATTTDRGQTWTTIPIPNAQGIVSLAIDPTRESVMYAAVAPGNSSAGNRVLKTTDGGKSWSILQNGLPPSALYGPLVIDPAAPSTIYGSYKVAFPGCGGCGGIVKSSDGGAHWTILRSSLAEGEVYTFALDPIVRGTIYAGLSEFAHPGGGIFRSADGGANWTAIDGPALVDVHTMVVNPVNPAIVYASAGDSVFQSVDSGENWAHLVQFQTPMIPPPPPLGNLPSGGIAIANSLAVDFVNPNILYARTSHYNGCFFLENFLFKSTDGGASWTDTISPPDSGCVLIPFWDPPWMVMDPTDPATLYVGESWGDGTDVIKTSDGGSTWRSLWHATDDFPDAVHALVVDPSRNRTLYAGLSGPVGGIFRSTDGGETWSSNGLDGAGISALALDARNPGVLYAAIEGSFPRPRGFRGLFKTTDGSANWAEANQGLDSLLQSGYLVTAIVIDPADSNTVYLATSGAGVFRSVNGGSSWAPFHDGLANLDVRVLLAAGNPGALYAGTAGGVFALASPLP